MRCFFSFCFLSLCYGSSLFGSEWSLYFARAIERKDPYPTLQEALENLSKDGIESGVAVDLGSGTGADTLFLLEQGWHVFAVDAEKEAIDITLSRALDKGKELLDTRISSFADAVFPDQVMLINASMSLPFCHPLDFYMVWKKITSHLATQGRFAGHFFGDRDEWASIPGRTHFTKEKVLNLFKNDFEVELFYEEEKSSLTA